MIFPLWGLKLWYLNVSFFESIAVPLTSQLWWGVKNCSCYSYGSSLCLVLGLMLSICRMEYLPPPIPGFFKLYECGEISVNVACSAAILNLLCSQMLWLLWKKKCDGDSRDWKELLDGNTPEETSQSSWLFSQEDGGELVVDHRNLETEGTASPKPFLIISLEPIQAAKTAMTSAVYNPLPAVPSDVFHVQPQAFLICSLTLL